MIPDDRLLDALAEFAAGVGHEINNPLAIISGHAQLLLSRADDPETRKSLAVIAAQVKRAYEMIADIRLFARPPKLEIERFDLHALVDELVEKKIPEFQPPGITVRWDHDQRELFLESDPVQLSVALLALVRNSLESLGENGTVALEAARTGDGAEISVSDDGPGVAEEIRPMIFSPFFSGRQAGRGLGFGLPKAWKIADLCGGSLRFETDSEGWNRFVLEIPSKFIE